MLVELQKLLDRGVRHFKFVDRTFNLSLPASRGILQFFLERYRPGLFMHFELIPDRLPDALREVICRFPAGSLQFEVGIQTFNETTGALIKRRQNYARLEENLTYLRKQTGVHIHADLIVGLPGEDVECFGAGFDRLVKMNPQEIQVGILKRLRGTPIIRHDTAWQMNYSPLPPYEILSNRLISFSQMQEMRRFARYWDLVGNSGNFSATRQLIFEVSDSPFKGFLTFSNWLYAKSGRTDAIALPKLMEFVFSFLVERDRDAKAAAETLLNDYQGNNRKDVPAFLRQWLSQGRVERSVQTPQITSLPPRQARHLARPGVA
jgi:hypothetical protein